MADVMVFRTCDEHDAWLREQSDLPAGFRVGSATFRFVAEEVQRETEMRLSLLVLDEPSEAFAAMFTQNAFCGDAIHVGRERLAYDSLGAVVVNNKIANVAAPGGREAAESICSAVGAALGFDASQVLPSSTGVIGWCLPVNAMTAAIPHAVEHLQSQSILPMARAIMTTDLYPKVRRRDLEGGSIVGIAKGAGMVEPNLATMLVFITTDLDIDRDAMRRALKRAVNGSFNAISIDTDQSTSDTVVLVSSRRGASISEDAFTEALCDVCRELAVDVVRNGEGVHHVMRVRVEGAPDHTIARAVGKSVVNSPLWQCAVAGNDPNVGRLIMAVGKCLEQNNAWFAPEACSVWLGNEVVFEEGRSRLDAEKEKRLVRYLKEAELYESGAPDAQGMFHPPINFPAHARCVDIVIDLGGGNVACTVWGGDRTHEYISENADYRS